MKTFLSIIVAAFFFFQTVPVFAVSYESPKTKAGDYAAAQSDTEVWAPSTGDRIVLTGVHISNGDTANVIQIESDDEDVIPPQRLAANATVTISGTGTCPVWMGDEDATLDVTSSAADSFSVLLIGFEQ